VDLAALGRADGTPLYPDASPPAPGAHSIGELKALDDRRFLVIERDNLGDDERPPQVKRLYLAELPEGRPEERRLGKTLLLDLLALPDPEGISGERGTFGLPFYTIESVHPVDERTLLVASDNNFPLSNGRARSETADRLGPLVPDATELVLVRLAAPLAVDPRLLPAHPESVP
jgi:hypothetical protein